MSAAQPHIILTVTNDLNYDQRMQRIAGSLAMEGYKITLVGRQLTNSPELESQPFEQVRIKCRFKAGKLFYMEYNGRLYHYLDKKVKEIKKTNSPVAICAIDLDTIFPCFRISKKFNLPRVYDAHELFTELTEVKRRPFIHWIWHTLERRLVPQFANGYTVNQFIADEFNRRYGVNYEVIRNMPLLLPKISGTDFAVDGISNEKVDQQTKISQQDIFPDKIQSSQIASSPFFLYQGAVNEGRSFETLIPAMNWVDANLLIVGEGNFFERAKQIAHENGLEQKVFFTGYMAPGELRQLTPAAYAGITIFQNTGLNQYYSLANRYFDYINAGIPQLCVNYPEYAALNKKFETSLLTDDLSPKALSVELNKLLADSVLYNMLKGNCKEASEELCWEKEAKRLIAFWKNILPLSTSGPN